MNQPLLIDCFCCQGGASAGYAAAGFQVIGIDLEPQPRYPYRFWRADALQFLRDNRGWIQDKAAAVAGSPPCQGHSKTQRIWGREWPDLIGEFREAVRDLGLPYVIENVEGAPLLDPVVLCGAMFGLRTYRHRLFETGGGFRFEAPPHPEHTAPLCKMGRAPKPGEMVHVVGNFIGVGLVREDWGVPWMNRGGMREGIPPAYTEFIGGHLMDFLRNTDTVTERVEVPVETQEEQ